MSWLSNNLKFNVFNVKDNFHKIKKDPERLLLGMGTVDPLSTKLTNKMFGKNYEPLTDLSGGPYGGHTSVLFSPSDGGTYQRAREAGLDTHDREQVQDAASVIGLLTGAAVGGSALGGAGGGGSAASGGTAIDASGGLTYAGAPGSTALTPTTAGGGSGGFFHGLLSGGGSKYMQAGMGLLGQGQPQQQSAPGAPVPIPQHDESARIRMMQEMQLQALRQKPNKTLEEWAMLQKQIEQPGLLGNAYA